jgi:hypothetical protein
MAKPTNRQRLLVFGLFVFAIFLTLFGIAVVWFLSTGPFD